MKFSLHRFYFTSQKYSDSTPGRWLRGSLAVGLAAVLLTPVGFGVSARGVSSRPAVIFSSSATAFNVDQYQIEAQSKSEGGGDSFIIEMIDGVSTCRKATPNEVPSTLPRPDDRGIPVRELLDAKSANQQNVMGGQDSSTGLTISLLALSQLASDANRSTVVAAFQRAAAVWTARIKSPVTINIKIDYGVNRPDGSAFPSGVLGSTSSGSISVDYTTARQRLLQTASSADPVLYNSLPGSIIPTDTGDGSVISVSRSLSQPLGLIPLNPNDIVATIAFNKNFAFDFNSDDGINPGSIDFVAVATHEIGHALGFVSNAGEGSTTPMSVWDMFRFRPGTTSNTFNSAQRIMSIGGSQVYFTGQTFVVGGNISTNELGLSTGGPDPDPTDGDGSQSSHWKADELTGQYIGIMDPTIAKGVHEDATDNDFSTLETLGWNFVNNTAPPPPPPPPGNDNFANAQIISGCSGSVSGTNLNATRETGEPNHSPDAGGGARSVWYQWQAPSSGSVTVTTAGSGFDTVLAVYTGTAVNALGGTLVANNDDIPDVAGRPHVTTSSVTFAANAGTTYRIALDGYDNGGSGGDVGTIKLNWIQTNCVPSNTWQFVTSAYSVAEGANFIDIPVTRGDTSGAATVDYSTNDFMAARCDTVSGVASAKCDYVTNGGTLRFAAGVATQTIRLSIIDDAFVEGNETLTIALSNATGTALGSPASTTITIVDNDSDPNASNPFLNNAFFVRQQYLDFLLREPDTAGFTDWNKVLNDCGPGQGWLGSPPTCDRVQVSSGFFRSTEFGEKGYWIYRFYEASLGRRPQFVEFMPEMRRLSGLMTDAEQETRRADFIGRFMQLPEFTNNFAGLTDAAHASQFIAKLEQIGRVTLPATATTDPGQPPQYGRQELINKMANSQFTAAQTLRAFIEQKVVWDTYFYRAFVAMQYFGYLRRDPEAAGYDDWVDVLTNGRASAGVAPGDYRHLIFGFVYSVEYRERFGKQ